MIIVDTDTIEDAITTLAARLGFTCPQANYVVIMNGAFMFAADLIRRVRGVRDVRFIHVDRGYPTPHKPVIFEDILPVNMAYPTVLLDVVTETNTTFRAVKQLFPRAYRKRIYTCALISKGGTKFKVDFVGVYVKPTYYVSGYGMAPQRHLRFIIGEVKDANKNYGLEQP